ncbi:(deoxy)nucleoside triphosphate pyrophosphohydrolase [Phytoactinopolyspora limicola]|uniref:(deoxy)nucleoside triphosphate pyrophosphohydrolase n=1 Tax=Phytoactinopolyspora limicola TaxID=2715536 RepID=UPI00140D21FB|nr:(deoxy)nucleoside triphosphate pyrophosphohydrolase [Phytoactinopolyspora limicola]
MSDQDLTCVVAAAIVDDLTVPRRLLAARRTAPPRLAGQWEFPGGKVERGERPRAALRRELREELGIEVRLGTEVPGPKAGYWALAPGLVMRLWWAVVSGGQPTPRQDHDELRWLDTGQWLDVPWLAADVGIVRHLVSCTSTSTSTSIGHVHGR